MVLMDAMSRRQVAKIRPVANRLKRRAGTGPDSQGQKIMGEKIRPQTSGAQ